MNATFGLADPALEVSHIRLPAAIVERGAGEMLP